MSTGHVSDTPKSEMARPRKTTRSLRKPLRPTVNALEASGRRPRRTGDARPTTPPPPSEARTTAETKRMPGAPTIRDLTVEAQAVLRHAMAQRKSVVIHLRDDGRRGPRTLEGEPIRFWPSRDGRTRIVLSIADGAEQTVLLERIERVAI